jgi:sterol desaturase/sphingolipid hydroxylase (fatty acid hydroxylase superfamily)
LPSRRRTWHLRYLLSFGLLYLLDVYAAQRFDLSLTRFLALWELQIVGFALLQSFVQYWLHRLEYTIPALWALHEFHHSADRMTILTSARQTQFTRGVEAGLVFLPMALLTSPAERLPATHSPLFVLALRPPTSCSGRS